MASEITNNDDNNERNRERMMGVQVEEGRTQSLLCWLVAVLCIASRYTWFWLGLVMTAP